MKKYIFHLIMSRWKDSYGNINFSPSAAYNMTRLIIFYFFFHCLSSGIFARDGLEMREVSQGEVFRIKIFSENPHELFSVSAMDTNMLELTQAPFQTNGFVVFEFRAIGAGKSALSLCRMEGATAENAYISYEISVKEEKKKPAPKKAAEKKTAAPNEEDKIFNLIKNLFQSRLYPAALQEISSYNSAFPAGKYYSQTVFIEADIYLALHEEKKACAILQKLAADKNAGSSFRAQALYRCALVHLQNNRLTEGARSLGTAVALYPEEPAANDTRLLYIDTLCRLKQHREAMNQLEELKKKTGPAYERPDEILFLTARIFEEADEFRDYKKALDLYVRYTETYPFSSRYQEALERKNFIDKHFFNIR